MKRFLFSMLLCLSITILRAAAPAWPMAAAAPLRVLRPAPVGPFHNPAGSPTFILGDIGGGGAITRGLIMNTILTEPSFANELSTIKNFLGLAPTAAIPYTYQQIVKIIATTSTDSKESIDVIRAFEKALMHKYDYDTYLLGSYAPWRSIVFTGIKWSCINPTTWFSSDPNLNYIINEIEYLAKVAAGHSTPNAIRMNMIVASHRFWQHWKRYLAYAVAAYIITDTCKHIKNKTLTKESIWSDLITGGLLNGIPAIASKVPDNLYSAAECGCKLVAGIAKGTYHWTQPLVDRVLFGASPTQPVQSKPEPVKITSGWHKYQKYHDEWIQSSRLSSNL